MIHQLTKSSTTTCPLKLNIDKSFLDIRLAKLSMPITPTIVIHLTIFIALRPSHGILELLPHSIQRAYSITFL